MQCRGVTKIIFPLPLFSTGFKGTRADIIKPWAGLLGEKRGGWGGWGLLVKLGYAANQRGLLSYCEAAGGRHVADAVSLVFKPKLNLHQSFLMLAAES